MKTCTVTVTFRNGSTFVKHFTEKLVEGEEDAKTLAVSQLPDSSKEQIARVDVEVK